MLFFKVCFRVFYLHNYLLKLYTRSAATTLRTLPAHSSVALLSRSHIAHFSYIFFSLYITITYSPTCHTASFHISSAIFVSYYSPSVPAIPSAPHSLAVVTTSASALVPHHHCIHTRCFTASCHWALLNMSSIMLSAGLEVEFDYYRWISSGLVLVIEY